MILPKASAYVKSYDDETKWFHFSIEGHELLENYKGIWNKVSNGIKKKLDCKTNYKKSF